MENNNAIATPKSWVHYYEEAQAEKAAAKKKKKEDRRAKVKGDTTAPAQEREGAFYRAGRTAGTAVKKSYDFLGFGGTVGLVGGALLTGGLVGGLVGLVVGKNIKPIASTTGSVIKSTATGAYGLGQGYLESNDYEEFNPSAKYDPKGLEDTLVEESITRQHIEAGIPDGTRVRMPNPTNPNANLDGTIYRTPTGELDYVLREGEGEIPLTENELLDSGIILTTQEPSLGARILNFVGNAYKGIDTKRNNYCEYKKLQAAAEELSKERGKQISPKTVYEMGVKKKKLEKYKEMGDELNQIGYLQNLIARGRRTVNAEEREQIDAIFTQVSANYQRLGEELGISPLDKYL
jgi:hypothetical protein